MITNLQILEATDLLNRLYNMRLTNVSLAFAVAHNVQLISTAIKPFNETRQKLINEYMDTSVPLPDGTPLPPECIEKINALVTMDSNLTPYLIDLTWITDECAHNSELRFTPAELSLITFLIKPPSFLQEK